MLNLNKTAVAVLVALGSTAASAGTMGPVCTAGNVTVPCETRGWDLGIAALYLQSNYDSDYGYYNYTTVGTDRTYDDYARNSQWGFKLEGSYHWGFGSDININWYHLGHDRHERDFIYTDVTTTALFPGAIYSRESRWDAVNFEWGQKQINSCYKAYRFHGGFQYAKIRTEDNFAYPAGTVGATVVPAFAAELDSDFDGFGPRWGINGNYKTASNLAFGFDAATAILVGRTKFDNHSTLATAATGGLTAVHGSRTHVVPELELSVNTNYHWVCGTGDAGLELGYMWVNYFNAQHNVNFATTAGAARESDFAVTGPYLRFKYVGAAV